MGGVELEVWRAAMRRWVRFHDRKTVANLLREYPREVQEWITDGDEELTQLLGLEAEVGAQGRLL